MSAHDWRSWWTTLNSAGEFKPMSPKGLAEVNAKIQAREAQRERERMERDAVEIRGAIAALKSHIESNTASALTFTATAPRVASSDAQAINGEA